jgi:hypothetical protein
MLRGPAAAAQICLMQAADAAVKQEGPWAASGLFRGLARRAATIPWCTGAAAPEQVLGERHSARGVPSGLPPGDRHRSAAVQSRRLFTCDVQAAVLSKGALPPQLSLLCGLPAACSHADLGRLQAQLSSRAECAGSAASPEERAAIVERLRRRLAERGLSRPLASAESAAAAAAAAQLPSLQASAAWEVSSQMKAAMRRGEHAVAAQLFDPSFLLQARVLSHLVQELKGRILKVQGIRLLVYLAAYLLAVVL